MQNTLQKEPTYTFFKNHKKDKKNMLHLFLIGGSSIFALVLIYLCIFSSAPPVYVEYSPKIIQKIVSTDKKLEQLGYQSSTYEFLASETYDKLVEINDKITYLKKLKNKNKETNGKVDNLSMQYEYYKHLLHLLEEDITPTVEDEIYQTMQTIKSIKDPTFEQPENVAELKNYKKQLFSVEEQLNTKNG